MTTTVMTSMTPLTASVSARPTSFMNTLAAEWSKVATLRSTYLTLGVGLVLSIGMTALVALALGSTQET